MVKPYSHIPDDTPAIEAGKVACIYCTVIPVTIYITPARLERYPAIRLQVQLAIAFQRDMFPIVTIIGGKVEQPVCC